MRERVGKGVRRSALELYFLSLRSWRKVAKDSEEGKSKPKDDLPDLVGSLPGLNTYEFANVLSGWTRSETSLLGSVRGTNGRKWKRRRTTLFFFRRLFSGPLAIGGDDDDEDDEGGAKTCSSRRGKVFSLAMCQNGNRLQFFFWLLTPQDVLVRVHSFFAVRIGTCLFSFSAYSPFIENE